ncbi:siderophore-interacting protein [Corynebacterium aquilae]|uniref:FAD-binding FR-type domain-containing protein n=1 Tax=Corynebacterium aquilae DSM 44791 TaxID=1431546 RepID=A0A1L7CEZ6_9CORY|nr:siderophore-interacting protein [Corynebacterium aquilae]APT84405.1 hypothetical protein CAQU_04210 [Corynebacterium aquilae DSM 44791]
MNTEKFSTTEVVELLSLVTADATGQDLSHTPADSPQRFYGNHTFLHLRILRREKRAADLTRLWFAVDSTAKTYDWSVPNLALRLEIPVTPEEFADIQQAPKTASRAYTVADYDVERSEFAVDFVEHGTTSPVMQWLSTVNVGDAIYSWEPTQHRVPEACQHLLLVADATALPAALSILRDHRVFTTATVITSADPAHLDHDYPFLSNVEIHHCSAQTGELSGRVVQGEWSCDAVWACGESGEMKPIRAHAKKVWELPKQRLQVFGYWRREHSGTASDLTRLRVMRDAMAQGEDPEAVEQRLEEIL